MLALARRIRAPATDLADDAPDVRRQVLAYVRRYPGVHERAVERGLALSSRLAAYHLAQLEADGQVQRVHETGFSRYFASPGRPRWAAGDVRFICLMRRAAALRIVVLLAGEGDLARDELGARLGLARASVSYHLAILGEAGLVASRREGRRRMYRLAAPEATLGRLANFTPLPDDLEPFDAMWHDLMG